MSKEQKEPWLRMTQDFDPDAQLPFKNVKFEHTNAAGVSQTVYITPDNGKSRGRLEGALLTHVQIREHAKDLDLNGAESFQLHAMGFISGPVKSAYTRAKSQVRWQDPANKTVDHDDPEQDNLNAFFNSVVQELTKEPDMRGIILCHLAHEIIPDNVNPVEWTQRFEDVTALLGHLSSPSEFPDEETLRELFFNQFPKPWCLSYARVPRVVASDTLDGIQKYMTSLHTSKTPRKIRSEQNNQGSNNNRQQQQQQQGSSRRNRNRKRGNGNGQSNKGNNSNKKSNRESTFSNKCNRGGCQGKREHEWKDCFYNRNGSNYKPHLAGNNGSSVSGGSRGNNRGNANAQGNYHADTGTARNQGANVPGNVVEMHHMEMPIPRRSLPRDVLDDTVVDPEDDEVSLFTNASQAARREARALLRRHRDREAQNR